MMTSYRIVSLLLVCLSVARGIILPPTTLAQTGPITVAYLSATDHPADLTSLDIYPTIDDHAPVVIYVHGGGWQNGDKSQVAAMPATFNDAGIVFVSVNYRLSPAIEFPVQAEDVGAAIGWVHQNIAAYGGDPTQLFLMGHSAGAHLVALVATDARYLEPYHLQPSDLSGVIPLDSQAYDLTALADARGGSLPAGTYVPVFGDDPAFWAFASPITYVTDDGLYPPFLLPYNSGGVNSRAAINEDFAVALRRAGGNADTVPIPLTHSQFVRDFGTLDNPVAPAVLEFIEAILADTTNGLFSNGGGLVATLQ